MPEDDTDSEKRTAMTQRLREKRLAVAQKHRIATYVAMARAGEPLPEMEPDVAIRVLEEASK